MVRTSILLKSNTSTFLRAFQMADSPAPSNASTQESSWLDETTHASPLRSTELLITSKTDDQKPKTQLTINRRFSRPKILVEDIQSKRRNER
jgi:hypothetical protein